MSRTSLMTKGNNYPFGSTQEGRGANSVDYRFGFNGKENDGEWGTSLVQDYGFRLYNPGIGKFLSVDPLAPEYPFYTPYQFAGNTPVRAIDLDGLETWIMYESKKDNHSYLSLAKAEGPLRFVKNGLIIPLGTPGRKAMENYYRSLRLISEGKYIVKKVPYDRLNLLHTYGDNKYVRNGYLYMKVGKYKEIPNSSELVTYEPIVEIRIPMPIGEVVYNDISTLRPSQIENPTEVIKAPVLNLKPPTRPKPPGERTVDNLEFVNPDPATGISVLGSTSAGWISGHGSAARRIDFSEVSDMVEKQIKKMEESGNKANRIIIYRGRGMRKEDEHTKDARNRAAPMFRGTAKKLQEDYPDIPVEVRELPEGEYGTPSIRIDYD